MDDKAGFDARRRCGVAAGGRVHDPQGGSLVGDVGNRTAGCGGGATAAAALGRGGGLDSAAPVSGF